MKKTVCVAMGAAFVLGFVITLYAEDCTTCPNKGQCFTSKTRVLGRGGVLDNRLLEMIPEKNKVEVTVEGGGKYIAKKSSKEWALSVQTCEGNDCPFRLAPTVKRQEPQPTLAKKKIQKKEVVKEVTKVKRSQKCGRRGFQRFFTRPRVRNVGWRIQALRSRGCCN